MNNKKIENEQEEKSEEQNINTANQTLFAAPLAFTSGIIHGVVLVSTSFWVKSVGFSYATIGIFSLTNIPTTFKMFWIPIFDKLNFSSIMKFFRFNLTFPAQRKGWLIVCMFLCSISMFMAGAIGPSKNIVLFALCMVFTSFWYANGDSIIFAYNMETLKPKTMGITTGAYKFGHFVSAASFLFLHEKTGITWSAIYMSTSVFIFVLTCVVMYYSPTEKKHNTKTWNEAFIAPYSDIIKRYKYSLITIVLFFAAYKVQDRLVQPMQQLFLRETSDSSNSYFILKLISTLSLIFSAVRSSSLIQKYTYEKAFVYSVSLSFMTVISYLLISLKLYYTCISCVVLSFWFFYLLTNEGKNNSIVVSLVIALATILGTFFFYHNTGGIGNITGISLSFFAMLLATNLEKIATGIKSSLLNTYRSKLFSKEYTLSQLAIFESMEKLAIGEWIGALSGTIREVGGSWTVFYLINAVVCLVPLLILLTREKIVEHQK